MTPITHSELCNNMLTSLYMWVWNITCHYTSSTCIYISIDRIEMFLKCLREGPGTRLFVLYFIIKGQNLTTFCCSIIITSSFLSTSDFNTTGWIKLWGNKFRSVIQWQLTNNKYQINSKYYLLHDSEMPNQWF